MIIAELIVTPHNSWILKSYKIVVESESATIVGFVIAGSVTATLFTIYKVDGRMEVVDPREFVVV